ncbi:MAG TPA: hypothetical protein PLL10_00540, partial [Elusimicrobiales bacterium]|nr:hypothetical protein [Elusimicrobiales bacterium]
MSWLQAVALGAALALLAGFLVLPRLETLPGLHFDEAWAGDSALDYKETGKLKPLGMNWYTGPYHVWLVGKTFSALQPGIGALRLPGALLNISAAGIFGVFAASCFGLESFLAFSVFILALPFYAFESRLAWEVTALQNMLAALMLIAAWRMAKTASAGLAAALVFS